jgi:hypothetical protein
MAEIKTVFEKERYNTFYNNGFNCKLLDNKVGDLPKEDIIMFVGMLLDELSDKNKQIKNIIQIMK